MRSYFSLLGTGIILLTSACATDTATGIWITGNDAQAGFDRWEATAPPETRELIQRLKKDRTLLIHVREGKIRERTRGTKSLVGSAQGLKDKGCSSHPPSEGIASTRNWDLIYDEQLQAKMEKELGIRSPIEVLLHHELVGHILPALEDPKIIERQDGGDKQEMDRIEDYARRRENEYRRAIGLPLMRLSTDNVRGH